MIGCYVPGVHGLNSIVVGYNDPIALLRFLQENLGLHSWSSSVNVVIDTEQLWIMRGLIGEVGQCASHALARFC